MWLSRDRNAAGNECTLTFCEGGWLDIGLCKTTESRARFRGAVKRARPSMEYSVGLGVTLLFVLVSSGCATVSNSTDCRDYGCSTFALVGECNQTSGICSCDTYNTTERIDCFYYDSNNFCQVRDCWNFINSSGRCVETGKERLTALLLSIFLINFGAANFYIERYDLAVPQIILGLLICFFQCGSCALNSKRDDDTSKLCIICCSVNAFFSLFLFSWWIADIIIFATNSRDDGDGCSLLT